MASDQIKAPERVKPPTEQPDPASAFAGFAMADPSAARIYANGFTLGLTNADVFIVLQMFGRPIGIVNVSYTLAKTLSQKLEKLVSDWEAKTGHKIETTDTIDRAFAALPEPSSKP
jgi:hypothetical protein